MVIVFLGPPGAGKGTQARILHKQYESIKHLESGAVLRDAMEGDSQLSERIAEIIEMGEQLADELVNPVMKGAILETDDDKRIVLDGYPRTVDQAWALDEILEETKRKLQQVIYFHVDDVELNKRLRERRVCPSCRARYHPRFDPPRQEGICDECGAVLIRREYDRPKAVRKRLNSYHERTDQLRSFYRQRENLRSIKASEPIEAVTRRIKRTLDFIEFGRES